MPCWSWADCEGRSGCRRGRRTPSSRRTRSRRTRRRRSTTARAASTRVRAADGNPTWAPRATRRRPRARAAPHLHRHGRRLPPHAEGGRPTDGRPRSMPVRYMMRYVNFTVFVVPAAIDGK
jgi:hypothetical protein